MTTKKMKKIARARRRRANAQAVATKWEMHQKQQLSASEQEMLDDDVEDNEDIDAEERTVYLVGFDKIKKIKVEFGALYPEMLDCVPVELCSTPQQRIRIYKQIMANFRQNKSEHEDASGTEQYIPWNMIDFPEEFGRQNRCDLDTVARIFNNFTDHQYHVPRVAMLPVFDANGKITNVRFLMSDGWHRRAAKLEIAYRDNPDGLRQIDNPFQLQCFVTPVKNIEEAAQCFSAQNSPKHRRTMVNCDNWRARVVAKDEAAMAVVALANKYGLNAESPPNKTTHWPYFTSGDIIERMMFEFVNIGVDVTERTMSLLADNRCRGVYKMKTALKSGFFGGLCHFIAAFERPGFAHDAGIIYMLSQEDIIGKIEDVVDNTPDDMLRREFPTYRAGQWSREENKRFVRIAAAFSIIYSRYVPTPNSKTGFWAKCPSALRKLRHLAPGVENDVERDKYIASLQSQLAGRGFDAKWPKYSANAVKFKRLTR